MKYPGKCRVYILRSLFLELSPWGKDSAKDGPLAAFFQAARDIREAAAAVSFPLVGEHEPKTPPQGLRARRLARWLVESPRQAATGGASGSCNSAKVMRKPSPHSQHWDTRVNFLEQRRLIDHYFIPGHEHQAVA